ncbi:MAG: sulfur carrier protein ThiS [Pseudomonadota bacterium]
MIDIEVNGEPHRVAIWTTLLELVTMLELPEQGLALAVNRSVVPRQVWRSHVLLSKDRIEIVRAIGGG